MSNSERFRKFVDIDDDIDQTETANRDFEEIMNKTKLNKEEIYQLILKNDISVINENNFAIIFEMLHEFIFDNFNAILMLINAKGDIMYDPRKLDENCTLKEIFAETCICQENKCNNILMCCEREHLLCLKQLNLEDCIKNIQGFRTRTSSFYDLKNIQKFIIKESKYHSIKCIEYLIEANIFDRDTKFQYRYINNIEMINLVEKHKMVDKSNLGNEFLFSIQEKNFFAADYLFKDEYSYSGKIANNTYVLKYIHERRGMPINPIIFASAAEWSTIRCLEYAYEHVDKTKLNYPMILNNCRGACRYIDMGVGIYYNTRIFGDMIDMHPGWDFDFIGGGNAWIEHYRNIRKNSKFPRVTLFDGRENINFNLRPIKIAAGIGNLFDARRTDEIFAIFDEKVFTSRKALIDEIGNRPIDSDVYKRYKNPQEKNMEFGFEHQSYDIIKMAILRGELLSDENITWLNSQGGKFFLLIELYCDMKIKIDVDGVETPLAILKNKLEKTATIDVEITIDNKTFEKNTKTDDILAELEH